MTEPVISTRGLRKVYRAGGRVVALDGLDLDVAPGTAHGFLGPNGAGKTTTIEMLLGLTRPTRGEARLFGRRVPAELPTVLDRVGAVVQGGAFFPGFSARRNLVLLARSIGLPRKRVDQVLEQVGLPRCGRQRYATLSHGSQRRLALAAALLKSPDLLILDEPTAGMDPAGIRDVRDLVRDLVDGGATVLLSSHNLAEVQQACDEVSILGSGRLLAGGRVDELLGDGISRTRVGLADPGAAADVLDRAGYEVTRDGSDLLVQGHERPEEISRVLAEHGHYVRELSEVRPDLETVFLRLTGEHAEWDERAEPDEEVAS